MFNMFFCLSQGLTGPLGPPGPSGPNGEKVGTVTSWVSENTVAACDSLWMNKRLYFGSNKAEIKRKG